MKMTLFVTMATLLPGIFLMQANGGMWTGRQLRELTPIDWRNSRN